MPPRNRTACLQVENVAKLRLFSEGNILPPTSPDGTRLLVILRGAVSFHCHPQAPAMAPRQAYTVTTSDALSKDAFPDAPVLTPVSKAPIPPQDQRLQTNGVQTNGAGAYSEIGHAVQQEPSEVMPGISTQPDSANPPNGRSSFVHDANQTGEALAAPPTAAAKLDGAADGVDILDARGCAFGLPGFLQQTPLEVQVKAKTVVEAFEVPWALLQVRQCLSGTHSCAALINLCLAPGIATCATVSMAGTISPSLLVSFSDACSILFMSITEQKKASTEQLSATTNSNYLQQLLLQKNYLALFCNHY